MNPEWVGYSAAFLTTAAYLPQLIKVLRHRHTKSLSLVMYIFINCGVALWFAYGVMLHDLPLMLANGATSLMAITILLMKLKHG